GLKKLEIRKNAPKGYWVYVYVTKAKPYIMKIPNDYKKDNVRFNGKVVARFWFDEYDEITSKQVYDEGYDMNITEFDSDQYSESELEEHSCLEYQDLIKYFGYKEGVVGYAWHIKNLEIFDEPKELSEFYKWNKDIKWTPDMNWNPITKAPQSYMYVYTEGGSRWT
ncbi:MAG: hypothetical protein PF513_04835, partial [Tenericutes bacterium]|nr:hypothetical protein [Mycoplasmatota bacterium]